MTSEVLGVIRSSQELLEMTDILSEGRRSDWESFVGAANAIMWLFDGFVSC